MELQDLIKQYPELGEVLAEMENRLSFLENSLPYSIKEEEPSDKEIQVITKYMYAVVPPLKKGKYKKYIP